tara:strand:- start:8584 stop:9261 length:678 start_codon:yes stop_codon:yes gene_type:complete
MSELDLEKQYEKDYFSNRDSDKKRMLSYHIEYEKILSYVKGGSVLDIGCGLGEFLELFGKDWNKYGIEISKYASSISEKKNIKMIDFDFDFNSMDLIIFRGTIQHLDKPLWSIQKCINMLKPNGYMIFLATPNTNSIHYRLFKSLPALDPKRNFILPSDIMLKQILENFGLRVIEIRYPYRNTPYSNIFLDHLNFLLKIIGFDRNFAFWGNMMECYAKKPGKNSE